MIMPISIIVAMDKNKLIGKNNQLPWRLPADLAFFKKVTINNTVIMGRNTYESIGKPLTDRRNIIISTNKNLKIKGCEVFNNIEDALDASKTKEVFIIGGAKIWQQTIDKADKLYITKIEHTFTGDTYFPKYDENNWQEISSESHKKDEKNPHEYHFKTFTRKSSA